MKKLLLIVFTLILSVSANAQTATNFNCADCAGATHDLFTELDSGNVVVLCWVMPCTSCIAGALTCSNINAVYPPNLKFYMADDEANTVCTSLISWAGNNNIVPDATFSNASINMLDYGSAGMPKVVVIGGSSHTVFFNANNSINPTSLQNAIDQAMIVAGVNEKDNVFSSLSVFPSPAKDVATVNYSLSKASDITIEVYNLQGEKLQNVSARAISGENKLEVNVESYASGMYLVKVTDGKNSQYANLVVSH